MRRLAPRSVMAVLCSALLIFASAGSASAAPTADFTASTARPAAGQPVTFTFTGTCDVPPCRIQWRWFRSGGSSLGTSMGEGSVITYAFTQAAVYSVVARITNSTSTHGHASATHGVIVHRTFQDSDRNVRYNGWRGVADAAATGGGYRAVPTVASASLSFSGTSVTFVARTGPDGGIANVSVDGVARGSVDLYDATPGSRSLTVDGLAAAAHRFAVRSAGTSNPASTGIAIALDEVVLGTTHVDDVSPRISYDSWAGASNPNASDGTVRSSTGAGASTTLNFIGESVTWVSAQGPDQGRASISIDGKVPVVVDNYAAVRTWKLARTFGGLTFAQHTIKVVVTGTRNASSTANRVTSDAFIAE
jgi:hypothetical protein